MKKIDVILMNPPFNKDLHLKFLEKTIEIADNVVNISPHDWITNKFAKTEKSKFRRDFREKYSKYIKYLENSEWAGSENSASVPYLGDYTKLWTNERLYRLFNITKEEQKIIEDMI